MKNSIFLRHFCGFGRFWSPGTTPSVCENFVMLLSAPPKTFGYLFFDRMWRFFWFFNLVFELRVKRPLFLLWNDDFALKNFHWRNFYGLAKEGLVPVFNIRFVQFMSNFTLRDFFYHLWLKIGINVFVVLCSLLKSHINRLNFHQWGVS